MNQTWQRSAPDELYPQSGTAETAQETQRNAAVKSSGTLTALAQRYRKPRLKGIGNFAFFIIVIGVLAYGWSMRNERLLTAEEGVGYYLGIVGGSMMLVLLFYPLRKRMRSLSWLGRVPSWFRIHMLFGILGPVLVLFHSNFKMGSLNSSVALISMLAVAGSGLIGRFFYGRTHHGLYGAKALVNEVFQDANMLKQLVGKDTAGLSSLDEALKDYEQRVFSRQSGVLSSLFTTMTLGLREAGMRRQLSRMLRDTVKRNSKHYGWSRKERRQRLAAATVHLTDYFSAVRKAAQFGFYERLFALWHVLHLPLFFFLVLTACIHVVAVHLY